MRILISAGLLALLTLLAACNEPEPRAYDAPRDEPNDPGGSSEPSSGNSAPMAGASDAPQGMQVLPGMEESTSGFPQPTWSAPADWSEEPASGLRRGTFRVSSATGQAELTVTVFPGDVGGTLANINRWRRQVGLGPVGAVNAEATEVDAFPTRVVFLEGNAGQSILGAMVDRGDHTWFFKMMGDTAVVANERNRFDEFLTTVDFPE